MFNPRSWHDLAVSDFCPQHHASPSFPSSRTQYVNAHTNAHTKVNDLAEGSERITGYVNHWTQYVHSPLLRLHPILMSDYGP